MLDLRVELWYILTGMPPARIGKMAVQLHHPKGGERMPITVTFHFRGYTVTIRIKR